MTRRREAADEVTAVNIRPVSEAVANDFKAQAARQGAFLGPYLAMVVKLVAIVEREARKSGAASLTARHWLAEAGMRPPHR